MRFAHTVANSTVSPSDSYRRLRHCIAGHEGAGYIPVATVIVVFIIIIIILCVEVQNENTSVEILVHAGDPQVV